MQVDKISTDGLFILYADIIEELKTRNIVRTKNNIVSDYAEYLVSKNLDLELMPNSNKHFDAIDKKTGEKFQIKSRRTTDYNRSKLLGVIRDLDKADFDYLVVVYFNTNFKVIDAYIVPKKTVKKYAKYNKHQNGYRISLKGKILEDNSIHKIDIK